MYSINKSLWGIRIKFSGNINAKETERWFNTLKMIIASSNFDAINAIIDIRSLENIDEDSLKIIDEAKDYMKNFETARFFIVSYDDEKINKFKSIFETINYLGEMVIYLVTSENDLEWEKKAINWIQDTQ